MRYTYHSEQWLPYSVDLVFAFFADPENLPRLMPPAQKARIEEATLAPAPPRRATDPPRRGIAAGVGTRLTISFKPFLFSPFRIPWEAEITDFIWNHRFCDRQLRGPFAYWNHCHNVRSEYRENTSGTLISDDIQYEMPFGKFGELAQRLFITRQLRNTFDYRHVRTSELLSHLTVVR